MAGVRKRDPMPEWGWQQHAACRGEDLGMFFGPDGERGPERGQREELAKDICAVCPVQAECLGYAAGRPERYGVWGGMNEDERQGERRRRQRRARVA